MDDRRQRHIARENGHRQVAGRWAGLAEAARSSGRIAGATVGRSILGWLAGGGGRERGGVACAGGRGECGRGRVDRGSRWPVVWEGFGVMHGSVRTSSRLRRRLGESTDPEEMEGGSDEGGVRGGRGVRGESRVRWAGWVGRRSRVPRGGGGRFCRRPRARQRVEERGEGGASQQRVRCTAKADRGWCPHRVTAAPLRRSAAGAQEESEAVGGSREGRRVAMSDRQHRRELGARAAGARESDEGCSGRVGAPGRGGEDGSSKGRQRRRRRSGCDQGEGSDESTEEDGVTIRRVRRGSAERAEGRQARGGGHWGGQAEGTRKGRSRAEGEKGAE